MSRNLTKQEIMFLSELSIVLKWQSRGIPINYPALKPAKPLLLEYTPIKEDE